MSFFEVLDHDVIKLVQSPGRVGLTAWVRGRSTTEPVPCLFSPSCAEECIGVRIIQARRPWPQPAVGQLRKLEGHDRGLGSAHVTPDSGLDDAELHLLRSVRQRGVLTGQQRQGAVMRPSARSQSAIMAL